MSSDADLRSKLLADLAGACSRGELVLEYQPEFDLRDRRILAVEALVRWSRPQHGLLGPDAFIGPAEQSGLINEVGSWVIGEATRALARLTARLPGLRIGVRVNVSPVQLADADAGERVVEVVTAALAASGLDGRRLCLELTESAPVFDLPAVVGALARLTRLGVTSALDDLGSGFGSLSRLRALPVDDVKLDRGVVSGVERDTRAQAIVGSVVRLAQELGLGVVAEGVADDAEIATLVQLGCWRAQGFYLCRPLPEAGLLELLEQPGTT